MISRGTEKAKNGSMKGKKETFCGMAYRVVDFIIIPWKMNSYLESRLWVAGTPEVLKTIEFKQICCFFNFCYDDLMLHSLDLLHIITQQDKTLIVVSKTQTTTMFTANLEYK